jgi:hypothetical protein
MFGKRKILKDGEKAQAVVLDSDMSGYSNSKGIHKYHLQLRVQFDDGSTVETKCSAYPAGPMRAFNPGDIVPVRYYSKDRSLVEVDRDELVSAAQARQAEGKAGLIKMAEQKLAGEDPNPNP